MRVTVRYHAGPYSGERIVEAPDTDGAIRIVQGRIRKEMTLPMYYESYKVVSADDDSSGLEMEES